MTFPSDAYPSIESDEEYIPADEVDEQATRAEDEALYGGVDDTPAPSRPNASAVRDEIVESAPQTPTPATSFQPRLGSLGVKPVAPAPTEQPVVEDRAPAPPSKESERAVALPMEAKSQDDEPHDGENEHDEPSKTEGVAPPEDTPAPKAGDDMGDDSGDNQPPVPGDDAGMEDDGEIDWDALARDIDLRPSFAGEREEDIDEADDDRPKVAGTNIYSRDHFSIDAELEDPDNIVVRFNRGRRNAEFPLVGENRRTPEQKATIRALNGAVCAVSEEADIDLTNRVPSSVFHHFIDQETFDRYTAEDKASAMRATSSLIVPTGDRDKDALAIATNIVQEASIKFIGVGDNPETPDREATRYVYLSTGLRSPWRQNGIDEFVGDLAAMQATEKAGYEAPIGQHPAVDIIGVAAMNQAAERLFLSPTELYHALLKDKFHGHNVGTATLREGLGRSAYSYLESLHSKLDEEELLQVVGGLELDEERALAVLDSLERLLQGQVPTLQVPWRT